MLTSKKLIYFILFSLILVCGMVGVDYRSSYYSQVDQEIEIVDFYSSGFYATGSRDDSIVSVVTNDDDEGAAVAEYVSPEETPSQTEQAAQTTSAVGNEEEIILTLSPVESTQTTASTSAVVTPELPTATTTTTTAPTTSQRTLPTATEQQVVTTRVTTTTTTTTRVTTRTTTRGYTDSGDTHFAASSVNIYVGSKAQIGVNYSFDAQRAVTFSSLNTAVVSVRKVDNSTVEITGKSKGTTYICGTYSGGTFYCMVTVNDYATEVIRLINIERSKYGLGPLYEGPSSLQTIANARLNEIMINFSHSRPDGRSFSTIANDFNFSYRYLGENLGFGFTTPQQVVDAWMNSTAHRRNILSQDPASGASVPYQYVCIAYGTSPYDGLVYWTQIFYTPQ